MNPLLVPSEIQSFLDSFPSQSRRRGKHYYADRAVISVACVEPERKFKAVVRGSEDYEVTFEYDAADEPRWDAECTCPIMFECKHAYAAMLALSANATKLSAAPPALNGKSSGSKKKTKTVEVTLKHERQPPASALSVAMSQALGRSLNREETWYVQLVQWSYQQARGGYTMTADILRKLAPGLQDNSWQPLTLWADFPGDDLRFWLYCAWELRGRGVSVPEFMRPVTDFSLIEAEMRAWERRKEIELWRAHLANASKAAPEETELVDFRLVVLPHQARVQWKAGFEANFKDLKQAHLRQLSSSYASGALAVTPEAMALWLVMYNLYDSYTGCNYGFERPETATMLGRVLRVPSLAERILTAEGAPMERPAEALRYE